ncbi:esterase [Phocaeicola salanitronis DSM 18170]|uniref:Esterase n=1 Tax=Phocaeicola salanitronis (strain DSM 18170 / JCM 13657 / CCUG 60908 / BL78) TaxID=667015 RepID=F0R437_PHOSB|nr:alpha/beta hydrolase-fold protein [Phocaeicola salanitronis]ADY36653.1 esterase [Phocaeicola salanitronis DSM 18170]
MKKTILLLYALLSSITLFAQNPWGGPQSKVMTDSIYSETLKAWRAYTVYLPKSYEADPTKKYPILYLLHGVFGTNEGWFRDQRANEVADQLMASGEACEMIIVSPNAGGNPYAGDWNGYFNMPGWAYEDFFYTEFLPHIEKTYRVIGDKQHRAIAGLSMGGGGTTSYAQRHAELYCAAYAMSALMDIPETGAVPSKEPGDKMTLLNDAVKKHSCIQYVTEADDARKAQLRTVQWYVDCGDDDFLLERNMEFVQAMRLAGVPLQFRVRDGGHTNEYWHTALFTCLPFVSRCFGK